MQLLSSLIRKLFPTKTEPNEEDALRERVLAIADNKFTDKWGWGGLAFTTVHNGVGITVYEERIYAYSYEHRTSGSTKHSKVTKAKYKALRKAFYERLNHSEYERKQRMKKALQ